MMLNFTEKPTLLKSALLEPHQEIKNILVAVKVTSCRYNGKQCGVIAQKATLSTQNKHHYNSGRKYLTNMNFF